MVRRCRARGLIIASGDRIVCVLYTRLSLLV